MTDRASFIEQKPDGWYVVEFWPQRRQRTGPYLTRHECFLEKVARDAEYNRASYLSEYHATQGVRS